MTAFQRWIEFTFINGILHVFVACSSSSCEFSNTGQYCDSEEGSEYGSSLFEESGSSTQDLCVHGFPTLLKTCICDIRYTGENCDALIEIDSQATQEDSGDFDRDESSGTLYESQEDNIWPVNSNGFSGNGVGMSGSGERESEERNESGQDPNTIRMGSFSPFWSKIHLDEVKWKIIPRWMYSVPTKTLLSKDEILDEKFAVIGTGMDRTSIDLSVTTELSDDLSNVYRFSFLPNEHGGKSRLELSTCFSSEEEWIRIFGEIPTESEILIKTLCPVIQLPQNHIHIHEYELYIAKDDIDFGGQYIITQWHGTPEPTILQDSNQCVAKVSAMDLYRLCIKGGCQQGEIFDHNKKFIGIKHNQGGYPPLTMSLKSGHFIIMARSDERVFMEKGGCSDSGIRSSKCRDHPRQQHNVLWTLPIANFKFDSWVKFKWEIKWSQYSTGGANYSNPGSLTSDAMIRVWMDDEVIVDWTGPCGRNDGDRIPFFKIGVYNPSGSPSSIRFFMRGYKHTHIPTEQHPDKKVRNSANKLSVCSRRDTDLNRNAVKSFKKLRFATLSSGSAMKCTLHAENDYLAFLLAARFGKMKVNTYTQKIISHLIYELENQNLKIESMQKEMRKYRMLFRKSERIKEARFDDEL